MYPDVLLTQFAASEVGDTDLFATLGIDWMMLGLQLVAFLVLVAVLGKFVYPVFMRIIDEREARINESLASAREAADRASNVQQEIDEKLATARKEAKSIVATAKDEATSMLAKADEKAKSSAEHMLETARDEIAKEVSSAKKALYNETIDLVALATEKVIGSKLDAKTDKAVIKKALEETK